MHSTNELHFENICQGYFKYRLSSLISALRSLGGVGELEFSPISRPSFWLLLWFLFALCLCPAPFSHCLKNNLWWMEGKKGGREEGRKKNISYWKITAMLSCAIWQIKQKWCWGEPLNDSRIFPFVVSVHWLRFSEMLLSFVPVLSSSGSAAAAS